MADFCLVSRRTLDDFEYRIYRYHHLLERTVGCAVLPRTEDGARRLFPAVYKIERKLGEAFAQLEPYPLYPAREYCNSMVHKHDLEMTARTMFAGGNRVPLALSAGAVRVEGGAGRASPFARIKGDSSLQ